MSLAQPLAPGTVVATDYRVEQEIARGGMGTLYRVTQLSTGADRVLKVMHARLLRDPRGRERFLQEARASARIESDHVVQVLAAGFDDEGVPWIVMELLRGEDLSHTLRRRGALPPAEVLEVFRQLGHALAAAHRAGLVHRDLKPDNVFLCVPRREGVPFTVKLLDFGIAKALDESAEPSASQRQTSAVGTPLWMAPEQAQRGEVTPAADVWSLGLLAFKLLVGRSYWRSGNVPDAPVERVLRELFGEPIDPASARARELGAALPPGFDAWFARCVVRDPRQRFRDAAEALAALTPVLLGPLPTAAFSTHDDPRRGAVPATVAMPLAALTGAPAWPSPSLQGNPSLLGSPHSLTPPAPTYHPMYSVQGTLPPPPAAAGGSSLLGAAVVGVLLGGAILVGGWFALTRYRHEHPADAGVDARAAVPPRAADVLAVGPIAAMELSPPVSTVSAGFAHTCARIANGTVRCWGWNQFGQLGDATVTHRATPVPVAGLTRVVEVVVGHAHSCARRDDGTVRCWGLNSSGQLGDNTRRSSSVPVTVLGVAGALQLALGEGHTCARLGDATLRCWGDNTHGQLGDGTATTRAFAGAVPGVVGVEEVAAGNLHTCVRLADTTVRCWGASNFGQVGDGYAETHYRPAAVAGLTHAAALALGPYRSCARLDDGSVRCWGRNDTGQLGDGTRLSRTTPVAVVGLAGALDLGLGAFHGCARMIDHTLRCWGSNAFGQLADGTTVDRPAPIPAAVARVVSVSVGEAHTCARTSDGAVRCWGANGFGQVGDGATVNHGVPFVVPGL